MTWYDSEAVCNLQFDFENKAFSKTQNRSQDMTYYDF